METFIYSLTGITLFSFALNWIISLIRMQKEGSYFFCDLKQLWPDSLPYIKAQWPIIAICTLANCWDKIALLLPFNMQNYEALTKVASITTYGLSSILELFYISYLAADKYPGRLGTIGIRAVAIWYFGELSIALAQTIASLMLIAPGMILGARLFLTLPIYALEGQRLPEAIKTSWKLTADKYWLASQYLGLPMIVVTILVWLRFFFIFSPESDFVPKTTLSILEALSVSALFLGYFSISGMSYKLYARLTDDGKTA